MVKTYLLFIYGAFEDHDDIEFFCNEILAESHSIDSIKYVIENSKNIIVIFDSEYKHKELSEELHTLLVNDSVKFYFIFERSSLVSANLPIQMKDFIFKPNGEHTSLRIEYPKKGETMDVEDKVQSSEMDLDIILEKIEKYGIESLSSDEKKFLDDFEL